MKAKEYYQKYKARFQTSNEEKLEQAGKDIFDEFKLELKELSEKRHVKKTDSVVSIINELNDKWNAVCRMFEKDFGYEVLRRNAPSNILKNRLLAIIREHTAA